MTKYRVWYDVWRRGEKKEEPVIWLSFKSPEKVLNNISELAQRALRDGRTITITISPQKE